MHVGVIERLLGVAHLKKSIVAVVKSVGGDWRGEVGVGTLRGALRRRFESRLAQER